MKTLISERPMKYVLALWITMFCLPAWAEEISFPTDTLSIATREGEVRLEVEVATTPEQHEHGLMFRKELAQDHGMLFEMERPQHVSMWMKNTPISLDMLFIDDKGKIVQVVRQAQPESTNVISSATNKIRAVLEIKGGAADYYHIAKGDLVIYPAFQ